ncbi:MAG TPA: ThuA domain-containing protein [Actinophytocola sp.]|uniref:ThuA domain-containing protein n=1 Tax=Actinophytocola sp. TaxID=1872138 RepID=UPI002DB74AE7|nr:ThuA domain-containing protein [Actinophytocola sp.]HEU5470713.1 ThuA domain-containing protein [Actinophytocola sp.]
MNRRSSTWLTALASAAVACLATALVVEAPSAAGDRDRPGATELGNPDYGVCRGDRPQCYHDWGNFDLSNGIRVLIFSRTAGPRHANLGPALAPGLNPPLADANVAQRAIVRLGQENGFTADWTEDITQLATPARLFNYNTVIFLSTSRDTLDDAAQTALRQYIRGGGGFVAIHNAFGTEYNWPWYEGLLGNANFYDHGPRQPGTIRTLSRRDASTQNLPSRWTFTDEWYNLIPFPTNVRILATVDESSLAEGVRGNLGHPGHGDNHPIAWCQYYDGGRSWVTTLGHDATAFTNQSTSDGSVYFQSLIVGGIRSTAGATPFCR